MDWSIWDAMESLLARQEVRPILGVVPDNRDPKLMVAPPAPDFWERVRGWQARGWSIGLHGYQHTYVNAEPGILRLNRQSEFAGLGYDEQYEKLRSGLAIFSREGVRADAWIAPAHSFDWVTVSALNELGIRIISDGFAFSPYRDLQGTTWVPQQFANMRSMPMGVWTFCCHPNHLSPAAFLEFRHSLERLRPGMISLDEAVRMGNRPRAPMDRLVEALRMTVSSLRRIGRK
jgi:peptidoglycan/xylan/chitin deacetylase (PgdA/CDA1 family)